MVCAGRGKAFGTKTFLPPAIVEVERVFKYEEIQINLNKVSYWEHVGTHMDAPNHFSEGSSVEKIPAEDLVLPLAVIDIKAKCRARSTGTGNTRGREGLGEQKRSYPGASLPRDE